VREITHPTQNANKRAGATSCVLLCRALDETEERAARGYLGREDEPQAIFPSLPWLAVLLWHPMRFLRANPDSPLDFPPVLP